MITVSEASQEDIPEIINLYMQEHWFKEGYDTNFITNKPDTCHILVAKEDGKVIGTAQVDIIHTLAFGNQPYAAIEFVVVNKEHRRKGVASKIFEQIDKICLENDCESAMLTSTIYRTEAHLFYEEMGYVAAVRGFRKEFPEKIITKREANKRIYKMLADKQIQ